MNIDAETSQEKIPSLRTPRKIGFLPKVALLLVSLTLALCVFEGFLRVVGVPPSGRGFGDPVLGFTSGRDRTETFNFPEYGGMLRVHVNNLGFFEEQDTPLVKAPGTYRIVAMGDSQTAGECADDESFPNVLETMLNRRRQKGDIEVINAGAGRYSPYQYYVKTVTQLVQLKPNHLIVGIYMGNDFMDLLRKDDRPYLTISPDGSFIHHDPDFVMLDDPSRAATALESLRLVALGRRVLGPSILYQISRAHLLLHDVAGQSNSPTDVLRYMISVKRLTDISLGFMTQSLLQHVWFEHFPKTIPIALTMNRHVMTLFRDLCNRNGIRLTYVLIPTKLTVEPEDFQPMLAKVAKYDSSLTLSRLQGLETQLAAATVADGHDLGVEVVDLRPALLARRAGRRFYNPEEMHLRPEGNRAVALTLYESLGDSILSDADRTISRESSTSVAKAR